MSTKLRPKRQLLSNERLTAFREERRLSLLEFRYIFGLSTDLAVRELLQGKTTRKAGRPTMLLLRFFERHPEFVPQIKPMSADEVMEMFNKYFALRNWELSPVFGRASASGYRWLAPVKEGQSEGRKSHVDRISDLFSRLRAAGWSDELIVRTWLENVYWFYMEEVPQRTRHERVLIERIGEFLTTSKRAKDDESSARNKKPTRRRAAA